MKLANETTAVAERTLTRCFDDVHADGPWQWQCVSQNGGLLSVRALLSECFLHLDCPASQDPGEAGFGSGLLEHVLFRNSSLPAGIGFALRSGNNLRLCADIAVLDESQLQARIHGALDGFHHGIQALFHSDAEKIDIKPQCLAGGSAPDLAERIRESGWAYTERGPGEYSAPLDAASAPPAIIRAGSDSVVFAVELVRLRGAARVSHQALATFLLTICGSLRLVRACAWKKDEHTLFALQVSLPAIPAADEIGHSLAVLSLAYRICAHEAAFLLDEDAACCYLAAREFSSNHQPTE